MDFNFLRLYNNFLGVPEVRCRVQDSCGELVVPHLARNVQPAHFAAGKSERSLPGTLAILTLISVNFITHLL